MNINNSISSICEEKCKYTYNYSLIDFIGKNRGNYLSFLPIDGQQYDKAIYNGDKYRVKEFRIYQKSLHNYGGIKMDAELLIIHEAVSSKLNVCIPIRITGSNNINILDNIVKFMADGAPNKGGNAGKINMGNLATLTLNDLIPKKTYLVHDGIIDFPLSGEYIVFRQSDPLYISADGYKKLTQIIDEHDYNIYDSKNNDSSTLIKSTYIAELINKDSNGPDDTYECFLDEGNNTETTLLQNTSGNSKDMFNNSKLNLKKIIIMIITSISILVFMFLFSFVVSRWSKSNPEVESKVSN
tara:strand:+ start:330 stop:1223 length:894 start_codon:yes stop_codon:yes gene_type:complete